MQLRVELECFPPPRNPFQNALGLNARLAPLIRQYNPTMKPTLVFCGTRKDAAQAALAVQRSVPALPLVTTRERAAALQAAANRVVDHELKVWLYFFVCVLLRS